MGKHPAWLGKAMQSGGGVSSKTRSELEQAAKGSGAGASPGVAGLKTGVPLGAAVVGALGKKMPTPLRGLLMGIGGPMGAKSAVNDFNEILETGNARDELRKRAKADEQSGGYKRGGRASKKKD